MEFEEAYYQYRYVLVPYIQVHGGSVDPFDLVGFSAIFFAPRKPPENTRLGILLFSDENNQHVLNVGLRARGAVPRNIFLQPATEQPHCILPIFVMLPVFSIDRLDLE